MRWNRTIIWDTMAGTGVMDQSIDGLISNNNNNNYIENKIIISKRVRGIDRSLQHNKVGVLDLYETVSSSISTKKIYHVVINNSLPIGKMDNLSINKIMKISHCLVPGARS